MTGNVAYMGCGVGNHLRGDPFDSAPRQKVLLPLCLLARIINPTDLLVLDGCFVAKEADCDLVQALGQGAEIKCGAEPTRESTWPLKRPCLMSFSLQPACSA